MPHAKNRFSTVFSFLLSLALLSGAFVPAPTATAGQSPERARKTSTTNAENSATPRPTPTPRAPVNVAPTPRPSATPTTFVTPLPSPTPLQTATRTSPAPQTLEELRARISEIMRAPQLASSHLAVKVASLDTGRVLFEENANKWLQPASNMKLYTVAAALDRLSPDFRFKTSVYAASDPDAAGTITSDLVVYGRGDPTFATRFYDISDKGAAATTNSNVASVAARANGEDVYYKAIDELAAGVVAAGVRRVEGDLVGDESYFNSGPLAPGWEWDDLQWAYGAEVSALSVNDNAVDVTVTPGAREGTPCVVTVGPATAHVTVVNRTTTLPRGASETIGLFRPLNENVIEVSGGVALGGEKFARVIAVTRPALLFTTMLRSSLERRGVVVRGKTRTIDARTRERDSTLAPVSSLVEIASRQSHPFSVVAAQTMKPSQNLYTELILRALGEATRPNPQQPSDAAGMKAVTDFLIGAGVDASKLLMSDGSGLSRSDLITAGMTVQLLTHMSRHRHAAVFRDSQPVAGVDGTLRNRMKNTPAAGNVRAKTGTLSSATSLSGYVTSAAGERLVFSLMINNPPRDRNPRADFTDAIAVLLASFAGRS